ncbi:MAG: PTS sugar transporter subunit IIA [Rectinemataceae bacterium]|jgi:mannitol/fructose-specific phosphotransferase system IIA component (Ntr-type)
MKSLLEALKEGRLIELPDDKKEDSLELLAHLIEAVPDIGTKVDLMKSVMEREAQANTAIGRGLACPHCRVSAEGELLCAVGWSPTGIDYGAPDGKRVHLLVMYYVPDRERNSYLKEISGLAKAVQAGDTIESISALPDIHSVREKLLDWVGMAISESMPDAKARMIKLEARQAAAAATPSLAGSLAAEARIIPFRLVAWKGGAIVLCRDPELGEALERAVDLAPRLDGSKEFDEAGYRIALLSETLFSHDRKEFDAVAIQLRKPEVK